MVNTYPIDKYFTNLYFYEKNVDNDVEFKENTVQDERYYNFK